MNKSKFLKKSLAMLLAIMMVVAMIPLSAAAEDAPTDPAPTIEPPTVTVNNRTATKPADGSNEYNVTVQDATTVSIAWVPVEGYTAQVVTARDVTIKVPFSGLDLLNEATVISEKDVTPVVYQVTFQVLNADKEVVGDYKLNITSVVTVANDDTTIKTVRPNQQFRNGDTDFAFIGIEGNVYNETETIVIKLPLGMTYDEAGFGDGTTAKFGAALTLSDADGLKATGEAITINDEVNNRIARRVFIPNSVYSTVVYKAPTTPTGDGRLTVTARDGHTRNYTVKFEQEEALTNLSVVLDKDATHSKTFDQVVKSIDSDGTVTYHILVDDKEYFTDAIIATAGAGAHLNFEHGDNVVRVEDPDFVNGYSYVQGQDGAGASPGWFSLARSVSSALGTDTSYDLPIKSGQNTLTFVKQAGPPVSYVYYLTVKTEANMEPNETADINDKFYKNVKLVISEAGEANESVVEPPVLHELQINGYDSVWDVKMNQNSEGLPTTINYYVDYQFQFSTGDGQHPARITATTNSGNKVAIPAQDPSIVKNRYWGVKTTDTVGGRLQKPVTGNTAVIDNVNTEGATFVLRVWNSDKTVYKDYTINLIKPNQDTGTKPEYVSLMYKDKDNKWQTIKSTKADTNRNFNFDLDAEWFDNYREAQDAVAAGTTGTLSWTPATDVVTGSTTYSFTDKTGNGATKPNIVKDNKANLVVGTGGDALIAAKIKDGLATNSETAKDGTGNVKFTVNYDTTASEYKLIATPVKTDGTDGTAIEIASVASTNVTGLTITFALDASVNATVTVTVPAAPTGAAGGTDADYDSDTFDMTGTAPTAIATAWFNNSNFGTGTYTAPSAAVAAKPEQYSLNAALQGAYILVDTPEGAVVTPGGTLNGVTTTVGMSSWGVGDGYAAADQWPNTADWYTELEEGVTKVDDWYTSAYMRNNGKAVGDAYQIGDGLASQPNACGAKIYFSVKNGREGIKQAYTITFSRRGTGDDPVTPDAKPELSAKEATSAVEEDLVYAGNNSTNGIIVQNANQVYTPYVTNSPLIWTTWNADGSDGEPNTHLNPNRNPAFIQTGDSAYIGAMNGHNTYDVEVAKLANSKNEYVITVIVPEDFRPNLTAAEVAAITDARDIAKYTGEKDGMIYFTNLTATDVNSAVYRGGATATDLNPDATTGKITSINLDMLDQTQQGNANAFKMTKDDMLAWNGAMFDRSKVSAANKLYVFDANNNKAHNTDNDAFANADSVYYVTVKKRAFETGDSMTINTAGSSDTKVHASINQATKTVTVSVPSSYNTIGYHADTDPVFDLVFSTSNGALLIDAAQDTAIDYLREKDPNAVNFKNFTLPDLIKREQEVDKWVSSGTAGATATKFFVKDGELYIDNEFTGTETQITGLADSAFINNQWGVQEARQSELHVYSEGRNNVNNYKLELVIREESSEASITHLLVDETTAELDPENDKLFTVALPQGTNPEAVKLSIAVSEGAEVESVNGAPFDPNDTEKTYDITKPITIIIVAEDGTPYTYTLSMDGSVPTPSPTPSEKPSPSPTPDFDASKYADLDKLSESVRAEVIAAMKAGLVQGIKTDAEPYEFGVGMSMRRYQMALLIARADLKKAGETGDAAELDAILVEKYGTETPFTDLGNRADAAKAAIAYCLDKGYMKGVSDTEFNPNGNLSRQEAAVAMARVAGLSDENKDVSMFKDGDKIANWAKGYVRAAYDAGLVNGLDNGNFGPTQNILRQHAVCLFTRAFLDEDGNIKDPDDGDEPSNPDDGDEPSNPDDGDEPSNPDDGDEPSNPDEGDEPSNPDEGSEPSNPDEGSEPSNPDEGGDTSEPSTPDEGGDTSEPIE